MKEAVLILLLIALLQNASLARPMDSLELTLQPQIQREAVENGPSGTSQIARAQSVGVRLRREAAIVSKTPDRFCTGCFSVIGDPTRPQQ
ncbi:hypothetical protein C0J50_3146 [Silurus asotus]|uniref:Secreted protein n=1 Tax=Silurus asotus TaxID=30991 RepID=A0AAD5FST2_SILAS|nr:hypothetical protein C0J50_3146 [Silurus asotus]